jgi:histidine triad (HIT) family protein
MISPEQTEQIRKQILEQLSKFPEEQAGQLKQQIQNATPEQLEKFISSQQGDDKCIFCEIVSGNIETIKVFEDSAIFVMMDINPANLGHIIIIPKQHHQFIFQIPDEILWDIMRTAKLIIPSLINITRAKGFNILMSQGTAGQQRVNHFSLNIIPRFENDKVSFEMERKQMTEEQKDIAKKLGEIFAKVREEENSKIVKKEEKKVEEKIEKEVKEEKKFALFPRRRP